MASYQKNEGSIIVKDSISGTTLTSDGAYVLISYGANGYGSFTINGSQMGNSANADELQNSYTTYYAGYSETPIFISKPTSNTFDDIVYYKTKNQINSTAVDTGLYLISLQDCLDNSLTLASVVFTSVAAGTQNNPNGTYLIRNNITVTERINSNLNNVCSSTANTYDCGDEAVLGVMWNLQDICAKIYPSSFVTKSCPGTSVYNSSTDSCQCTLNGWTSGTC
jgi:hypothetical protein